jgi:hypothetical protein
VRAAIHAHTSTDQRPANLARVLGVGGNQPVTGVRSDREEGGQPQTSYLDGVRRDVEQAVRLTSGLAY